MSEVILTPKRRLVSKAGHGTRSRYHAGCRCEDCRMADRAYARAYYAKWKLTAAGKAKLERQRAYAAQVRQQLQVEIP